MWCTCSSAHSCGCVAGGGDGVALLILQYVGVRFYLMVKKCNKEGPSLSLRLKLIN